MDVSLTPEQQRLIDTALQTGEFRDATEVLDEALHALQNRRRVRPVSDTERRQAVERLRTFAARHRLSLPDGMTVKELIDEGRR